MVKLNIAKFDGYTDNNYYITPFCYIIDFDKRKMHFNLLPVKFVMMTLYSLPKPAKAQVTYSLVGNFADNRISNYAKWILYKSRPAACHKLHHYPHK